MLTSSTNRFYFSLNVGTAANLRTNQPTFLRSPFRMEQVLGLHTAPGTGEGFAVSFVLAQTFATVANDYSFAPRIRWDIALKDGYAIYFSPFITLGYNLRDRGDYYDSYDYYGGSADAGNMHQMDFQLGLDARMILIDRFELSFRPIGLNVLTTFEQVDVRWNVVGGVGVTF